MPATILLNGVATTTARVNLRQGAPDRRAAVLRKIDPGVPLNITGLVVGEAVQGNAHWFALPEGAYVWAGACGPFQPTGLAAPAAATPAATPAALAPSFGAAPLSPAEAAAQGVVANVIDLYHGDRVRSFDLAREAGVLGVIHKATTGQTGRDELYDDRRTAAKAAGLLWGAYHWGTARPARDQVDNFLDWARPDETTLVALDYERTTGNQMSLDLAGEFLTLIEEKLGRKAVIYSGELIKSQLAGRADPFFGAHRLWLAQYGSHPTVQASWSTFWLWQYTDGTAGPGPRSVAGVPGDGAGRLDCDYYPGGAARLAAEWAS